MINCHDSLDGDELIFAEFSIGRERGREDAFSDRENLTDGILVSTGRERESFVS